VEIIFKGFGFKSFSEFGQANFITCEVLKKKYSIPPYFKTKFLLSFKIRKYGIHFFFQISYVYILKKKFP